MSVHNKSKKKVSKRNPVPLPKPKVEVDTSKMVEEFLAKGGTITKLADSRRKRGVL